MKEMKAIAHQTLGLKEAEAEEDKQISVPEILVTNNITTPVTTATATTQTDTDELHNNTTVGVVTQTETEEVSLKSLLDKAEERLGEHINEMGSNILCQILPLLQNIQQEMRELRQESDRTSAYMPLSPEIPAPSPQLSQVLVTPEKISHHGNQLSASPVEEVEEEATEGIGENKTVELEQIVDEVEKNDTVEEETIEGIGENQTVDGNDTMKGDVSVLSFNTMESEEKRPN